MPLKHKLVLALTAYTLIAVLVWRTMSDLRFQALAWLVLGLLAFKSVLHWYKETHPEQTGDTANGKRETGNGFSGRE